MKFKESYTVQEKVDILSRRLKVTYFVFGAILLVQAGLFFGTQSFADSAEIDKSDKVIRTKGIVIVDDQGRDRILIGSPIPASKDRVFGNKEKSLAAWKDSLTMQSYWDNYDKMHTMPNGMMVLNKEGFDITGIGEDMPDPNIGKRIGKSSGFFVNDTRGFERGGFGTINRNGLEQVGLGLDTAKGTEGINLTVIDDKSNAIFLNDGKNAMVIGSLGPNFIYNKTDKAFSGYMVLDKDKKVTHQFNIFDSQTNTNK